MLQAHNVVSAWILEWQDAEGRICDRAEIAAETFSMALSIAARDQQSQHYLRSSVALRIFPKPEEEKS